MKRTYVMPALLALSLAGAGFAQAQSTGAAGSGATTGGAAIGNNAGAAGTNNTSPNTTGSGNAPAERMGGSTTMGQPGATTGTGTGGALSRATNGNGNSNNAVSTSPQNNPGAPASGANSFTEGQTRSRIEDRGFKDVKSLKLDNQGIWRGTATRDGKQVNVAMDYQGNVTAQ